MIIRFETNLSHKIKIKKIVLIIEINHPIDEIIFHDKNDNPDNRNFSSWNFSS